MSFNLEQEFSLDMFPEIECGFIQHESILARNIHEHSNNPLEEVFEHLRSEANSEWHFSLDFQTI